MSRNDLLNKNVLRWRWKVDRNVAEVISSGSWFHVWGPETENARLPIIDSLTAGTRRLLTACIAQSPSARQVSDTDKWSQIPRCHTIHDFVGQQSDLVLYALWYLQPVETDQCISYVIRRSQLVDEPCSCIQYWLQSACEIGLNTHAGLHSQCWAWSLNFVFKSKSQITCQKLICKWNQSQWMSSECNLNHNHPEIKI